MVRGTKCRFLIDTGSTDTLISSTVYYQIPKEKRPILETEEVQVKQVDGSRLPVLGIAWVEVQVGRTTHQVRAVFTEMKYSGILCMDFLVPTGGNIDFQSRDWRLNGERIRCTNGAGEPFVGRVVVSRTTVIPSGHEAVVPGIIARKGADLVGPAMVEPMEGGGDLAKKGLVLARSLVETEAEVIPLRVFNPGREKRVAREGTTAGTISQVEVGSIHGELDVVANAGEELPKHLQDLFERGTAKVEATYHEDVRKCLVDFQDVLSKGDHDIGRTDVVQHHISTGDAKPFIKGFAEVASPLHALTEKSREFVWTESCQEAFDELKGRLQAAPVLSYPMPEGDFILDTDASGEGIRAVLSQVQGGHEKVLAYASRKLSKPERNYCVTRKELLAVVVYLKYFKKYLYGRRVTVRTDHAALRWVLNFKNPEGQLARWMEVLSQYDLVVEHRSGKKHGNADGLSRRQCKQCGREEVVDEAFGVPVPVREQSRHTMLYRDTSIKELPFTSSPQ
ncbi:uncharacterized protein LOC119726413 [Patiria miniata]|uniref:RNA-directed DNA polymerase n=1 Tax=Patiria miniata TaxID=46514 RepID=A0A913ZSD1_PATMI|nr:uncharacterized protein LOC119726413 [Patiria miniata]